MSKILRRVHFTGFDLFTLAFCLLTLIPGSVAYSRLPDQIAVHFSMDGKPDGYASRNFVVFLMPFLYLLIQFVLLLTTSIIRNEKPRGKADRVICMIEPVIFNVGHLICLLYGMGKLTSIVSILTIVESLLMLILGNYLPKARRNTFHGIMTPRTLAYPEVWDRTHRFAGVLYLLGGFTVMIFGICGADMVLILSVLIMVNVLALLYSEIVYRRVKKKMECSC